MEYRGRQVPAELSSQVFVGTPGTTIPTSVNPVGDYTTKLVFQSVYRDDAGLIDLVNNRILIPSGYRECRITYNLAWAVNATGWRGCRVKNSAGANYGNVRMPSVGAGATTNNAFTSLWITIAPNSAPNVVAAGDYFEFWPAHTAGVDLVCGADTASSFVQLEYR